MNFPTEMYRGEQCRVTFGQEEHDALVKDGWSDDRQAGKQYTVHTATPRKSRSELAPIPQVDEKLFEN